MADVEASEQKIRNYLHFDVSFMTSHRKHEKRKQLIDRVSDIVYSGQNLAIMGPSGERL
jgi:ABC-type dipeptide/oligopeptide/nickel transport system ATPase subunit